MIDRSSRDSPRTDHGVTVECCPLRTARGRVRAPDTAGVARAAGATGGLGGNGEGQRRASTVGSSACGQASCWTCHWRSSRWSGLRPWDTRTGRETGEARRRMTLRSSALPWMMKPGRRRDLARTSHTLAGAGSVLAAPRGFRALRMQPALAAARKAFRAAMPLAGIPQDVEVGPGGRC